ncbi:MAG TPA: class B sortase [Oscillospiraceae bacterium]|nr:class B sortase [Oscillospiraceae bacterium]HRW57911.1 class B sortase [Oscillospiraceae bacterium]
MSKKKIKLTKKKILTVAGLLLLAVLTVLAYVFRGFVEVWLETGKVNSESSAIQSLYEGESGASEAASGTEEIPVNSRFYALLEQNEDTIGWLDVEGIDISLPVVQLDNSFYLKHNFYGEESSHGTLFLSRYNTADPNSEDYPDDCLIIFGHNMLDGTMFSDLTKYRKIDFVSANPFVSFDTLWEDSDYVIVSVFVANTLEEQGEPFLYNTMRRFDTEAEKQEFIDAVTERSLIVTNVDVGTGDTFLMLSTCDYEFTGERLVVVARKLRADETRESFAPYVVSENPDPLMPDIWNELYAK